MASHEVVAVEEGAGIPKGEGAAAAREAGEGKVETDLRLWWWSYTGGGKGEVEAGGSLKAWASFGATFIRSKISRISFAQCVSL